MSARLTRTPSRGPDGRRRTVGTTSRAPRVDARVGGGELDVAEAEARREVDEGVARADAVGGVAVAARLEVVARGGAVPQDGGAAAERGREAVRGGGEEVPPGRTGGGARLVAQGLLPARTA